MTKQEAINAMRTGSKVTHRYFSDNEHISLDLDGKIKTEEGYVFPQELFWADRQGGFWEEGWEIKNKP